MLFPFLWRGSGAPDVIPVFVDGFPEHLMLFPLLWRSSRSWKFCFLCSVFQIIVCLFILFRFAIVFSVLRVVYGAGHTANCLVLQCINGAGSNRGRTQHYDLKNLILTLLCLIFRHIDIFFCYAYVSVCPQQRC